MEFPKRHEFYPKIITSPGIMKSYDGPIKSYFNDRYDAVFIALQPFFKLNNVELANPQLQLSQEITLEEAKKEQTIFNRIPSSSNVRILTNKKENYPGDKEILNNGIKVTWQDIVSGCSFANYADVNKALKTTEIVYRKEFAREDLASILVNYMKANRVFRADVDHFGVSSKVQILKAFRLINSKTLIKIDSFSGSEVEIDISNISDEEFVEIIKFTDHFIYDDEKKLLFSIGMDDFFFLICSTKENLHKINEEIDFEGFYCDDSTPLHWEFIGNELKK